MNFFFFFSNLNWNKCRSIKRVLLVPKLKRFGTILYANIAWCYRNHTMWKIDLCVGVENFKTIFCSFRVHNALSIYIFWWSNVTKTIWHVRACKLSYAICCGHSTLEYSWYFHRTAFWCSMTRLFWEVTQVKHRAPKRRTKKRSAISHIPKYHEMDWERSDPQPPPLSSPPAPHVACRAETVKMFVPDREHGKNVEGVPWIHNRCPCCRENTL